MAWQWATLLCCTAVQTRLPSAALQLLNDLVQLLFYHTEHSIGDPVSDHAEGTATHMQVDNQFSAKSLATCRQKFSAKVWPHVHS